MLARGFGFGQVSQLLIGGVTIACDVAIMNSALARLRITKAEFFFSHCCHHLFEVFVRHISQLLDDLRDVFDRICIAVVSKH
jgi:hypothetical protein